MHWKLGKMLWSKTKGIAPHIDRRVSVSKPFVMYRDPDLFCSFPSLAMSDSGPCLAFRMAPAEPFNVAGQTQPQQHLHARSFLAFCRLDTDLKISSTQLVPPDVLAADQDPNLHVLPDGSTLMTSFAWRPLINRLEESNNCRPTHEKPSGQSAVFWGSFSILSRDGGQTWDARSYLPPLPAYPDIVAGKRPWHGGRHRGQLVNLQDGTILMATYDRPNDTGTFSSYLFSSLDMAKTWRFVTGVAHDANEKIGFAEPTLLQLRNGKLMALHRTFGANDQLATSISVDNGLSWASPVLQEVTGHPYNVVHLPAGNHLLLYAVRQAPSSIRMRFINGENGTIGRREYVLRNDGQSKDIGYPAGIALDTKTVLVAYYWCDTDSTRYIEAVKVTLN